MFDAMFSPIKIRNMQLKNRVIMPAMGTRMATETREVTDRLIAYHEARAKGGCGLNIVEVTSIHTASAPASFVSISEECYIEGHKRLTEAIHQAGGKAGIQLWQGSIGVIMDKKAKIFVPSDMPFGDFTIPAMTIEEIEEIISCYGEAARRSVEAGYDCIELHCGHNYLPHSFLSGGFNHRTDAYGGSFEKRAQFPLACIQAIRANIPEDMPLFMRIDAHDDYLPGGMTLEDTIAFCKLAKEAGVDVLDVTRGNVVTPAIIYEVPPIDIPRGFNIHNASAIREATGMLTMGVGRINMAAMADKLIVEDQLDLVGMGRAQLADPDFCNKSYKGKVADIIHCVGCNQGCYDGFSDVANYPFITCLRNPMLGHERTHQLVPTAAPKKVLIVGGGMAGMEAALVLKERGHEPVIYEASDQLGGQFITAGQAPGKEEMKEAAIAFGQKVERAGIPVYRKCKVDEALIKEEKPEQVIIAIGARPTELQVPCSEHQTVYQSHDVLDQKVRVEGKVCVIGGGLVGLEVADLLATKGHVVSIIEMKAELGMDLGSTRKIAVMGKMNQLGVEMIPNAVCLRLEPQGVRIAIDKEEQVIACNTVVMAIGAQSNDTTDITQICETQAIPYHIIGDAVAPRRALDAIKEAFYVAYEV